MSNMWSSSLYKNEPTQHICMSCVIHLLILNQITQRLILDITLLELTNILHGATNKIMEPEDWEQYFVEAGISSCSAKTHAVLFANKKINNWNITDVG